MLARTGLSRRVPSRFKVSTRLAIGSDSASRPGNGGNEIAEGGAADCSGVPSAAWPDSAGTPSSRQSSADSAISAIALVRSEAAGVCHSDVHIWDGYFDLG